MIWILAWRNVWRNKVRSFVVITAIALGLFAGIFTIAFSYGMVNDRIKAIINNELSHIQLHHPLFPENNEFTYRIDSSVLILDRIAKIPGVKAVSRRLIIYSMAASAETGTGVKITGIEPDHEKQITGISKKILEGSYFESNKRNQAVIGRKLSEKLKIKTGYKIIITAQDVNKNIISGAFRVVGIYETDNFNFDEMNVFVRFGDLASLTSVNPDQAHEIAVLMSNNDKVSEACLTLKNLYPRTEVKDWLSLSPEAAILISSMNQYMIVFIIIILFALGFGIINTMLMVVLERVRELGMLMAVGMNKVRIFQMIMLETVYLSLTGGLLGIFIGYAISEYLGIHGLNLYFYREAFADIGYSSLVYPAIDAFTLWSTSLLVVITGVLASVYPALKALKLNPSEAVRAE